MSFVSFKRVLFALLLALAFDAHAQDARLSDAQIVGVLLVASQAEIAAGQVALRKTQSRSVQSFAGRIVAENQQVIDEINTMLQRLNAGAERSGTSDSLQRQSRDDVAMLDDTDEYSFDQTFLDREVDFLSQLLRAMDGYIRTTTNADVKTLLVRSRPAFTFHLDQAHRLRIALDKPGFGR